MVGLFIIILLGVFQGLLIISDNDYEYCYCFNGHKFNRVLFLLRHI